MPAYPYPETTTQFADLIQDLADEACASDAIGICDGRKVGFMVPEGETLYVTDDRDGGRYLITVRKVW